MNRWRWCRVIDNMIRKLHFLPSFRFPSFSSFPPIPVPFFPSSSILHPFLSISFPSTVFLPISSPSTVFPSYFIPFHFFSVFSSVFYLSSLPLSLLYLLFRFLLLSVPSPPWILTCSTKFQESVKIIVLFFQIFVFLVYVHIYVYMLYVIYVISPYIQSIC